MDITQVRGLVVIIKPTGSRGWGFKRVKTKQLGEYYNSPAHLIYNATGSPQYARGQYDRPTKDGKGGYAFKADGKTHKTHKADTHVEGLGVTNMLQPGDLPTLGGNVAPPKHWELSDDGNSIDLKSPADRTAADVAETAAIAAAERSKAIDAMAGKQTYNDALAKLKTANKITAAELTAKQQVI